MRGESAIKHPERFLSESFVNSLQAQDPNPQRKTTRMASRLSPKMWCLLAHALGITRDKPLSIAAKISSTTMRCLTLVTALVFGVSGLVVNVYEAVSEVTKITVLISVFKSAVGVFWILLGIYSYYLAVRSFSSRGLLDYIRLHSKTFMKVSSNVLTCFLCLVVLALNIYSNAYLVDDRDDAGDNNESTKPVEANSYIYYTCSHVELSVELCLVYFFSKVAFSCLALLWVLVVAVVCFSVCRTHTIAIRSFMKELSYDAKIFEEFSLLRSQQKNALPTANVTDEIHDYEGTYDVDDPRTGEAEQGSIRRKVWRGLRELRHSGKIASFKKSKTTERQINSCNGRLQKELDTGGEISSQEHQANPQHLKPNVILETTVNVEDEQNVKAGGAGEATHVGSSTGDGNDCDCDVTLPDLETMTAPIMSNEDVMLPYYKIVKHLTITSVLLQRWLTSSFVFSIMWCLLMVTYWTSHHVEMVDVIQFLLPLAVLALLISAYAEVNMEGRQLTKYILPTENRMIVLYYVNTQQPQLKVYGAVVSFKILATFITGIALTFATKIILNTI